MKETNQVNDTQNQQTPLVINTSASSGVEKFHPRFNFFTYFIFFFWLLFIILGLIAACILLSFMIKGKIPYVIILGPIFFMIIPSIATGWFPLYNTITIDKNKGIIISKKFSTCLCCWKKTVCNINEIKEIYSEINSSMNYRINNVPYNGFNIIIELVNGRKVTVIKGDIDKDRRKEEVLDFFAKSFQGLVRFNDVNCIGGNNNIPGYAVNNGNIVDYQCQQQNYAQPQIEYHPQYSVVQNMAVNTATPVQQYPNKDLLNNQVV